MFVNPQLVITASMFALSEILPYLPCKQNSMLQLAVTGLNKAKLIPDDVYDKWENRAEIQQTSAKDGTKRSSSVTTILKHEHQIELERRVTLRIVVELIRDTEG